MRPLGKSGQNFQIKRLGESSGSDEGIHTATEDTSETARKLAKDFESDIERANAARERYDAQSDFGAYVEVYFKTSAQRDAFVLAMGWKEDVDEEFERFVDGVALCKRLKIELPKSSPLADRPAKKTWEALAMTPEENKKAGGTNPPA